MDTYALNLRRLVKQARKLFKPPPDLTVSEWADRFGYVPREGNAEPGKFRVSRMPYQRDMLNDPIDPTVIETYWMIASQLGKTACIVIIVEYFIHQKPASILIVYPTIDSAKSWSNEKFTPAIKETPCMRGLIKSTRVRDGGNTMLNKKFPGGNITVCGANSPSGLRQRSKKVVILDEIDAFEDNAEGDPVAQADKRAETYFDAVKLKSSTPKLMLTSKVWAGYSESDRQKWMVSCPHCGEKQDLVWSGLVWPAGKSEDAAYHCRSCKQAWTDQQRIEAVLAGNWEATAPFKGKRGRHMNGLYRVIGKKRAFRSYCHEFANEFLNAKSKGKEALMVWTNTFLAEPWAEEAKKIASTPLFERREQYGPTLPDGVLVLTAGCDVQGDRIECEIVGWGVGEESWSVDYVVLMGNPLLPKLWQELDNLLLKKWARGDGVELTPACVCIDSGGHYTDEVYRFTKPRSSRRVFAIKGSSTRGQPIINGAPSRNNKRRAPVYMVGTDTAKSAIYGRLEFKPDEAGPGYMHFPISENYLDGVFNYFGMLCAEHMILRFVKGQPMYNWEPITEGRRNEALDCRVYNLAALTILSPNWSALSKNVLTKKVDKPAEVTKRDYELKPAKVNPDDKEITGEPEQAPQVSPARQARPLAKAVNRPRTSWVKGWR